VEKKIIHCATEKIGDYFKGYTTISCSQRTVHKGGCFLYSVRYLSSDMIMYGRQNMSDKKYLTFL